MHVEGKNLGGGKNYICPLRGFALCQSVEEGQHYVLSRQRKGDTILLMPPISYLSLDPEKLFLILPICRKTSVYDP